MMNLDDMAALMDGEDNVDLIYIDPPWSKALISQFYRIAGKGDKPSLEAMFVCIVVNIQLFASDQFCIEMGAIGKDLLQETLERSSLHLHTIYNIRYGKEKPCFIFHGGKEPRKPDDPDRFLVLRSQKIVEAAIKAFTRAGDTVLDFCIGQGMVARACHITGRSCYGLELSQKRLDRTIGYCMARDIPFEEVM